MLLFFAALNVFLAPLFLLISPLVLSFEPWLKSQVGTVALAAGGGRDPGRPRDDLLGRAAAAAHARRSAVHACALGLFCLVTGSLPPWPSLWTIGAGAFGMALSLTLVNPASTPRSCR